jgi:hypothetical protein
VDLAIIDKVKDRSMLKHRALFVGGRRLGLLPLLVLLLTARIGFGQGTDARDHFQLKIGAFYDQGDFGSLNTSRAFYTPVTLRYLGNRFDVSVTPSFEVVDSAGGIRLIDGVPTPTGERSSTVRQTQYGVGDTLIRGRLHLLDGSEGLPTITPFVKVKIPTAPANLSLGTGKTDYGFGVEADKQFSPVLLFGDFSYTVTGQVVGLDLQNRVGGSFGVGGKLSRSVTLSGLVDWRQSIIVGNQNPTELVGVITYRLSPTVTVSPNVYFGLNNASPAVGAGIELSLRFGRY